MTIIAAQRIRRLPYRGYDDPRLPVGMWWGSATVVGDASSGTMQVSFEFSAEGDPPTGDIYNLEQISALISDDTAREGFLTTVGMTPSRGLPGFDRSWRLRYEDQGVQNGNTALDFRVGIGKPLFIGTLRGGVDAVGAIRAGLNNLTATDSLSVSMMGYIWEARSVLAEGGPQRPSNSLFGD